ncbi:beta-galactosidase GalB [Pontiellaceae bacterium B12219]|nr:beta-galactosidase GalB [Pontiellaceae bacterium B12219]
MRFVYLILVFLIAITGQAMVREVTNFNNDWRFARFGVMPDGSERAEFQGLEKPAFDDSDWRQLDVPHDWAIEGPFRMDLPGRTGKLPYEGIGWYRKTFEVPASDEGKKIFIDFDGAMSRSKIYINGQFAGEWPYGYSSFRIDLTNHIKFGGRNVVAVRLDNKGESSRWYPGAGIYRNVRLVKTASIHVAHWGVSITTPEIKKNEAVVRVETELNRTACFQQASSDGRQDGGGTVQVLHNVYLSGSNELIAQGEGNNCSISISDSKLWDLETPNLYILKTSVLKDGQVVDAVENTFGIRTIEFTADRGFLLNGKRVQMNGVCMHHDLGPLGAAMNFRALERQVELLKEMGCNAIRTSHNPPAPELLDLCDRMGILLQVEAFDCWATGKTPNDYSNFFDAWHERDLTAMILRDRNHPSVVMWSTGNEVREQWDKGDNFEISQMLTDLVHQLDPTRPVSVSCNNGQAGWNGFQETMDLFGYNYKPHLYEKFKQTNPKQSLYGSETASTVSSRGEYFFPVSNNKKMGVGGNFQVSSYDLTAPPWANNPDVEFRAQDKLPYVFGEFVWTGFDYLGEPTPYNDDKTNLLNFSDPEEQKKMEEQMNALGGTVPSRSSYFGILDLCGFKKDRFYIYQARWRPELPMVHILPHWNWPERIGKITPVHVYTSGDEAELFLNGQSLGRKKKGPYEYRLRWDDAVYEPGELKVIAYKNGRPWAEEIVKTTDEAAKIDLTADRSVIRSDGLDLSFITVQVSDKAGLMVPHSHNEIHFSMEGPGKILAVGNGDATSHEPFQANKRNAFNGLCLVIVQSLENRPGPILLTAKSDGLESNTIQLESKP